MTSLSSSDAYDCLFKFIIIGDTNTGKSCLLRYFLEKKFKKSSSHTIGVEFGSKILNVGGKEVKLQIWDTAGQERFRSVTRSYYRGAVGCLLVYDITSRETYNHLVSWLADARTIARSDITVMVVGNKCDKKSGREVTLLEASRFAQENDLLFMETSALTGECVEEVFLKTAQSIIAKIDSGTIDPDTMLTNGDRDVDVTSDAGADPERTGCSC
jgi:Ras-related protein Rab-4B